jgi:AcrR family transcriptional regulator
MSEKAKHILKTAEGMFASGRFHEVTLDEICKRASVGKGTIYRYFEDKEDLYWQVILNGFDELVDSVQEVGQQEADPGVGLRLLVQRIGDFFGERKALFRLMWTEQLRDSRRKKKVWKKWHKKSDKILDVASDFIVAGLREGRYSTELSPAGAARLLMGMVRTAVRNREYMPGGNDWPGAVVDLFENGLLKRD